MANAFAKLRIVHIVNRTMHALDVTWDGVQYSIPAGYTRNEAGEVVGTGRDGAALEVASEYYMGEAAKRQHPVLGTLDPEQHLSYETYIGVVEWGDDISFRPQSEAIELLDRSLLPANRQDVVHQYVPGARKDSPAREQRRKLVAANEGSANPMGIRGEYPGGADYTK